MNDLLTIRIADNVCFWVRLPQNPVTPGRNISSHLCSDTTELLRCLV